MAMVEAPLGLHHRSLASPYAGQRTSGSPPFCAVWYVCPASQAGYGSDERHSSWLSVPGQARWHQQVSALATAHPWV